LRSNRRTSLGCIPTFCASRQPAHLVNGGKVPRIARNVRFVLKPGADTLRVAEELRRYPQVEMVSLNILYQTNALPNDTLYAQQWGMNRIGIPDGDWDVTPRGAIRVAVVDTGVDRQHPDFVGRIVFGAGYADDAPGDGDAPTDMRNAFDHGTHVAGIAAATRNNNAGVAGVSSNIELMAMGCAQWSASKGAYLISNSLDAIDDAVANGARVINCSFGPSLADGPDDLSFFMEVALLNALDHNVLVVVAAGNDALDASDHNWSQSSVPFIVSAAMQANPTTDQEVFDTGYSNFGSRIDLCAPGTGILSTVPTGGPGATPYGPKSGTSMATPHVAGAAAHLMSMNPSLLEDNSAKHLLIRMAQDAGAPGKDPFYGWGLLRLRREYLQVLRDATAFVSNIDNTGIDNGDYDQPWGDIQTGLNNIPDYGVLVLNGGDVSATSFSYPAINIAKKCTLTALPGSPVTIGQ
jgi:subtilisin family serine protease